MTRESAPSAKTNVGTTRTELRNALRRDRHSLDQATLKTLMTYNPNTGEFRWKGIDRGTGRKKVTGYVYVSIAKVEYLAHRLAWLYTHGRWPEKQLDHINRNPTDNRIQNLREVDPVESSWNTSTPRRNVSGFKGVGWSKPLGKWRARARQNGREMNLGGFDNILDAARAYDVYVLKERGPYAVTNFDPIEYL